MNISQRCIAVALLGALFVSGAKAAERTPVSVAGGPIDRPAACVYFTLASGTVQTASTTPEDFSYTASNNYWSAVGVRSAAGDDWDLSLYDTQAADPVCVSGFLAGSNATSGVDFIVGDYNHNALTQEWVRVNRFSGSQVATVEYDDGADHVLANGPTIARSTNASDVLETWDVYLTAGTNYTFTISQTGLADCKLLLFRNPASSPYWASRSARVVETSGGATYTAPATDWYGVVVVNDNGGAGTYAFNVRTCAPAIPLASGTVTNLVLPSTAYSFNQSAAYWTAVGVRETSTDWDIAVYGGTGPGPAPACFTTPLGGSSGTGNVDFVIGDFNVNPPGTFYVDAYPYDGETTSADVEWDGGANLLAVNDPYTVRDTGPADVLEVWDVYLAAGVQYTCEFAPTSPNYKLLVFENPGSSPYWTGRAGAALAISSTATYTPTLSGFHAIVVVNDDRSSGSYALRIGACTAPTALVSGTAQGVSASVGYYSFNQVVAYWTAVGVRPPAGGDWDIDTWGAASGSPYSACFGSPLASSGALTGVDFVVADFNHNATGTFFARPSLFSGAVGSVLEWDSGSNQIPVNGALIDRTTSSSDVLETWDLFLTGGVKYDIYFERHGAANTSLLLFQSPNGTYWAPRSSNILNTTSLFTSFTAPATDWYGVVVVNDNGATGRYRLGVATNVSDAGPGPTPQVTALRQVGPNPATGAVEIGFDLREQATVGLQVVDVAGRLVSDLPRRDWPAGHWSTRWDGTDASGRRAATGVYYVRMLASGREVGRQKLLVLH